jgi:hypothetical protein
VSADLPWVAVLVRNTFLLVIAAYAVTFGWRDAVPPLDWLRSMSPDGQRAALAIAAVTSVMLITRMARAAAPPPVRAASRAGAPVVTTSSAIVEPGFPTAGLPVGTAAPAFDAQPTAGGRMSLSSLLAEGRPVLLLFFDAACMRSQNLYPKLLGWRDQYRDRLGIAVLRKSVAASYGVAATPSAVLIDQRGQIASRVAVGAAAIEALVASTALE